MKSKNLILTLVLAAASFAASADTLYADQINKHQATFTSSAIHEVYDFYLDPTDFPDAQANIGLALTEMKLKNVVDIVFATHGVKLFDHAHNLMWQGTPTPAGGTADVLSFDDLLITTSHFSMTIDGTAVGLGATKGSYSYEIMAAPVPEPESYSMALAGVVLVGWAVNRMRAAPRT